MKEELSPQQKGWVVVVMTTWAEGYVSEDAVRSALMDSGEMDRWDEVRLRAPEECRLVDAIDAVSELLKTTPPGVGSPGLTRADGLLREVVDLLRNVRKLGG